MKYSLRSLMIAVLVLPPLAGMGCLFRRTACNYRGRIRVRMSGGRRSRAHTRHLRTPMKFSIRELLLVTLVVALALGWRVDHLAQRQADENLGRLLTAMEERGEEVRFTDSYVVIETEASGRILFGVPSRSRLKSMEVPTPETPLSPPKP